MWNLIIDNIWTPLFSYDFMKRALASLFILSLSAPVIGVFLSLRKLSLSGDALSHAILPGAAIGFLLKGLSVVAMTIGGILAGTLVIFMSALFSRLSRKIRIYAQGISNDMFPDFVNLRLRSAFCLEQFAELIFQTLFRSILIKFQK